MRTIVFCLLWLVGIAGVVLGVVGGRLFVYAHEAAFAREIGFWDLSPEQQRAFLIHLDIFKEGSHIFAWLGAATVVLTTVLFRLGRGVGPVKG